MHSGEREWCLSADGGDSILLWTCIAMCAIDIVCAWQDREANAWRTREATTACARRPLRYTHFLPTCTTCRTPCVLMRETGTYMTWPCATAQFSICISPHACNHGAMQTVQVCDAAIVDLIL